MNSKLIISLIIVSLLVSCSSSNYLVIKQYGKHYKLPVPTDYKLNILKGEHGDLEKQAVYSNNVILYITNDTNSGGAQKLKEKEYGIDIYLRIVSSDTITLKGKDAQNNYWKEIKEKDIVFGYLNVKEKDRSYYDSLLNKLIIK